MQLASLRDTTALVATRDAEIATITSERDVLKGEVTAARARVRDVASQLARFGQDLMEGVVGPSPEAELQPSKSCAK